MSKHRPDKHRRTLRINNGTPTQGFDSIPVNIVAGNGLQIQGNTISLSSDYDSIRIQERPRVYEIRADEVRINGTNLMDTIAQMTSRMARQDLEIQELKAYISAMIANFRTHEA